MTDSVDERDDFALMEAIEGREVRALSTLFERHGGIVFTVCLRILADRQEAEDVLLEVFWEVWGKANRFHPARAAPRIYLILLARSRAIDRKRRRDKQGGRPIGNYSSIVAVPSENAGQPHESVETEERRQAIEKAMDGLEESQRIAISLAFYDGLTHREIADRLDTPLGTIKARIRTGLHRLQEALKRVLGEREGN